MTAHAWVLAALVGPAVLLTFLCAVGLLAMRDPLQMLNFLSPPATLGAFAIAIAAFYDGKGLQSGGKALVVALVLTVMNGVVTHATARAAWVRALGRFSSDPADSEAFQKSLVPGADRWEDLP